MTFELDIGVTQNSKLKTCCILVDEGQILTFFGTPPRLIAPILGFYISKGSCCKIKQLSKRNFTLKFEKNYGFDAIGNQVDLLELSIGIGEVLAHTRLICECERPILAVSSWKGKSEKYML